MCDSDEIYHHSRVLLCWAQKADCAFRSLSAPSTLLVTGNTTISRAKLPLHSIMSHRWVGERWLSSHGKKYCVQRLNGKPMRLLREHRQYNLTQSARLTTIWCGYTNLDLCMTLCHILIITNNSASLSKPLTTYADEHYPSNATGVFPAESDSAIAILLVASKYSPGNFW